MEIDEADDVYRAGSFCSLAVWLFDVTEDSQLCLWPCSSQCNLESSYVCAVMRKFLWCLRSSVGILMISLPRSES
jgi:hypothetical protein